MSWKDGLLAASFRGVPFFYADTETEIGRRQVEHEFPLRDNNFVEDMGRRQRRYRIQAYVIGDDYFSKRDALKVALEAKGSGTLIHPYQGPLTVSVTTCKVAEKREDGRMASFEIEFVEAGANPSPTSSTDTSGASVTAAQSASTTAATSFAAKFTIANLPSFVSQSATSLLNKLQASIGGIAGLPGLNVSTLAGYVSDLSILAAEPAQLAVQVTTFFNSYADAVTGSFTAFDSAFSSRGPQRVSDPTYGLGLLAKWGSDLAVVPDGTAAREQESANQAALTMLVQSAAASALAQVYANTDFASENDAESARDTITGLLDDLSLAASAAGDDAAFDSLQALYQTASDDLTARGKQLPDVIDYNFSASLPALVLAERLYGDASRAGELIARNNARHPLFFPRTVEALSS